MVDGTAAILGARIHEGQTVSYKGREVAKITHYTYLLFNKPVGYVCSRRSQGDSPTIYELLPAKYHRLKTVGRLDRESSGLILLTDDGDFTYQMTHPSFRKVKIYQVTLDHPLAPLHQQMISDHGIILEDGKSQFELERLDDSRKYWKITMHEGRNRQIRRTFAALGYDVTNLHRTQFGAYSLSNLALTKTRLVSP